MKLAAEIDFDWIALHAGVPVGYLIWIPIFLTLVLTLVSMVGTREPENYKIGRHAEVKTQNNWAVSITMLILIAIFVSSFGHYFSRA